MVPHMMERISLVIHQYSSTYNASSFFYNYKFLHYCLSILYVKERNKLCTSTKLASLCV